MTTRHHVFVLLVLLCVSSILTISLILRIRFPWFPNQLCFTYITLQEKSTQIPDLKRSFNFTISQSSLCPNAELVYNTYCALNYWKRSARSEAHSNKVTLCTQGTQEFLQHIGPLCSRWQGPISVAVYCPSQEEYNEVTRRILELRECDGCIHSWVDWHLFYDQTSQPHRNESQFSQNCAAWQKDKPADKPKRNGTYPINVGRNLARWNAKTPYVFPSDIELYPSPNVLYRFELMLQSKGFNISEKTPGVYVLPVFEVWSKYHVPKTKDQLRVMFEKKHAISFHRFRCDICHRIPNLTEWLNYPSKKLDGATTEIDFHQQIPLSIWKTVKRSKRFKLQFWEPFFIARNDIPEFDYRLSWEGKQNKMQLAYEMCLLGYDFHILDDAFLVHAPGVNSYKPKKEVFRQKHVFKNNVMMKRITADLLKKYGSHKEC